MATNLTDQVRSISEVTKAVANGDLSRTVNVDDDGHPDGGPATDVRGKVARDGQASVPGVQGVWKVRLAPPSGVSAD